MNTGNNAITTFNYNQTRQLPAAFIMVCVYIFLFIERPWESISPLQGIPIERVFAIVMIIVAFLSDKFKIVNSPINKWVYCLLTLHFILAPFAFKPEYAVDRGIEYAKLVVFYLLMLAVADDERKLKILVKVYVFSMMFYVLHSLWEYHNGRHFYTMGISRMIGVDSTYHGPNAFSASIVLSLPFAYALYRTEHTFLLRSCQIIYLILSVICVILTGSRSSSVAFVSLLFGWSLMQKGKYKIIMLIVCIISISVVWINMPDEKRDRIRTLWDKNIGEGSAGSNLSAEGRVVGWKVSWKMFKQKPLTGVGAGGDNFIGYRLAHKIDEPGQESATESHNLYGEVLAEFGVFGGILFVGLIAAIWRCCRLARSQLQTKGADNSFMYNLGSAIIASLLLLLFLGLSGHHFYRPLWLWMAAWVGTLLNLSSIRNSVAEEGKSA